MEHSVDLSAKTFVQAVSPSSSQRIRKRFKKVLKVASANGSGMLAIDDIDGFNLFNDNSDDEENEVEVNEGEVKEGEDAADSIGKALLLVKQVSLAFYEIYVYS